MSRPRPPAPRELLRDFRGSLASLRSAAEALELDGGAGRSEEEAALVAVVTGEALRLSELIDRLEGALDPPRPRRRTSLDAWLAGLGERARRELDLELDLEMAPLPAGDELFLRGDGRALASTASALFAVFARLRRDFAVSRIEAAVRRREEVAVVDLRWSAAPPELGRLGVAHGELLDHADPPLRATVQAIGGEAWLTVDRTHQAAALHLIVPVG